MSTEGPRTIHGVDFSGAEDAGERIWISTGKIEDDGLRIECCRPVAEEWGASDRGPALENLREFITTHDNSAFGLDFSFGVPKAVARTDEWVPLIESFSAYPDPETMQTAYAEQARGLAGDGVHLKRATDKRENARSPYGFITRSQTYYGITEILEPLISDGAVSVLPMQSADPDRPWVLEIYPAATLEDIGSHRTGYKDRTVESRKRRKENLEDLSERIRIDEGARRHALCNDDALDSLVAAFATFKAIKSGPPAVDVESHPEGRIFV